MYRQTLSNCSAVQLISPSRLYKNHVMRQLRIPISTTQGYYLSLSETRTLPPTIITMKLLLVVIAVFLPSALGRLPYIIGGRNVSPPGKWPWQGSLQYYNSHTCGCALISSRWAITAAHCVGGSQSYYSVVLGMHDRQGMSQGQPKRYQVSRIVKHYAYSRESSRGFPNDIALLQLSQTVQMNSYVRTIALPNKGEDFAGNKDCWITGWGRTYHNGPLPNILQEAQVDVYTYSSCKQRYGSLVGPYHVCIGKYGKSGSCQGDSGGPLHCKVGSTWKLVGATSWGLNGCPTTSPSVYANVAYFRDWVRSTAGV